MAQKYYNVKDTAKVLGIGEDEVKQMLERRELHAYRDGTDWKFKVEDIDQLAAERARESSEEHRDVLLSDVELGQSPGASGTVIGMEGPGKASADSDVRLAGSNLKLGEESAAGQKEGGSKSGQFEELDLTLDEDLTLEDSTLASVTQTPGEKGAGDSTVDLTGKDLEDDDLVLGGSGAGSDITIGGDSGISLVDPADSGLSLEEPLELGGSGGGESLELGEDDLIALGEEAETEAPTQLKGDDDFLLTPLEEAGEDESESGSQVIALDLEGEGDEAATMVAGGPASMAAMLEEDLSTQPGMGGGFGAPLGMAPLGAQPGGLAAGAPITQPMAALPEAPYSVWNVLGLAFCAVLLALVGMMMFDLMRNMWSWSTPYSVNSSLMDMILSLFEK